MLGGHKLKRSSLLDGCGQTHVPHDYVPHSQVVAAQTHVLYHLRTHRQPLLPDPPQQLFLQSHLQSRQHFFVYAGRPVGLLVILVGTSRLLASADLEVAGKVPLALEEVVTGHRWVFLLSAKHNDSMADRQPTIGLYEGL